MARTDPVLVDSNVILDVAYEDPQWRPWSEAAIERAANEAMLVINPIIYAEISAGFITIEDLDNAVPEPDFDREPLPYSAGFLAGRAFLTYRRRGGKKRSPLPDFYIGAHAAVAGYCLLTRDGIRYRTYFPRLKLATP